MKQFELAAKGTKLILQENVIALISDIPLKTISSAIHNGGLKQTQIVINTQVTEEYKDSHLHEDPEAYIQQCFRKLKLNEEFVGMVTFANVADFALFSERAEDLSVSVIATAGCTHAESAGEKIQLQEIVGTINIIVLIDGNPSESCLASTIITATEAKTAALRELDVRSRYSGLEATGTITDAIAVASTCRGNEITYGGPASPLGQMVASCTRKAVKATVENAKIGGFPHERSLEHRLKERNLPVERLAFELSKIQRLDTNEEELAKKLRRILNKDPMLASGLFAAVKLNEELEKGTFPSNLGDANSLGQKFGELISKQDKHNQKSITKNLEEINLPSFLKQALIALLENELANKQN